MSKYTNTNDSIETVIVEDDSEEEFVVTKSKRTIIKKIQKEESKTQETPVVKKRATTNNLLSIAFNPDQDVIEMGIDEAGRGPMFGRVYAGLVILPKDDSFDHSQMKDSKKFHSKKKIEQVAEYIKSNAIAWSVQYEDEKTIDSINILQATQSAMHKCIKDVLSQLEYIDSDKIVLLVDGNYFKPYTYLNKETSKLEALRHHLVEGGDNTYSSIAGASILAKVERDKYIEELCAENPELIERYGIDKNKGYGSKKHMDGIREYGITKWHRRTFGICKNFC